MIKMRRIVSMLLVLLFIAGCISLTTFAADKQSDHLEKDDDARTEDKANDSSELFSEVVQSTSSTDEAEAYFTSIVKKQGCLKSEDLTRIEQLFDCDLNITASQQILDSRANQAYTRFICEDKTELSFDESGQLFKISTIYGESANYDEKQTTSYAASAQTTLTAQSLCVSLMPEIRTMFNISEEYPLTETYDFDEEYVFFTFEKLLENGVYNPYQSINIVFNKPKGTFMIARMFETAPNALTPTITEREALNAAEEKTAHVIAFEQAQLTYIDQGLLNGAQKETDFSVCYLVYKVTAEGCNLTVYVDALTGECIGFDMTMAENGAAFGIQESNKEGAFNYTFFYDENGKKVDLTDEQIKTLNLRRIAKVLLSKDGMRRLGYNSTSSVKSDSSLISDVKNFLKNDSNSYAFYFTGHGNESLLGFKQNGWIRKSSDVVGNWHFVFLDACKTAVNSGWASAFKINGYSRRAFLGWNGAINSYPGFLFATKFWPRIDGSVAIQKAAVDAASEVPGAGTSPIRFYGDRSYNGQAWN